MAKIPRQIEMDIFTNKTVQPNNWFVVQFPAGWPFDYVSFYTVASVQIQEPVSFQKAGVEMQGRPFSRPVKNVIDGYTFTITMEETEDWRVQSLIHGLERMNINVDGTHTPITQCIVDEIKIYALSPYGYSGNTATAPFDWRYRYTMEDCFFVKADDFTLSYDNPGKITRQLTFCCNRITRALWTDENELLAKNGLKETPIAEPSEFKDPDAE